MSASTCSSTAVVTSGPGGTTVPALELDVRDVGPENLSGFDAVVHLAALSNDPLGDLELRVDLRHQPRRSDRGRPGGEGRGRGALRLRLLVFDGWLAASEDDLLTEDAPLRPLTPYAESKVRAEEALHELADVHFSPVYTRNATAYGVSPSSGSMSCRKPRRLGAHDRTNPSALRRLGGRPLVHVQDIACATLPILEAPRDAVHDQAFNIGSEEQNVRIRELAETLRGILDCEVETSADATPDPRSYRVDFGKLGRALPAFRCQWTAQRGAEELIDAYRQTGLTYEEFQGVGRYTRLAQLKRLLSEGVVDERLRWRDRVRGRCLATDESSAPRAS